ncbi:MAG: hypothetical protein CHACPFDD_01721 [Phycisphaerae bacterium]|nr:hypothetical protein [Phycisphaerae bacterium]
MSTTMKRRAALTPLLLISLCGCANLVSATRELDFAADWSSYERIDVETRNGRVTLEPGGGDRARVTAVIRVRGRTLEEARAALDELSVAAEPSEDARALRVEFRCPEHLRNRSPGADLVVHVPRACPAEVRTSNGGIQIKEMSGELRLATSNGSIVARQVDGNVAARTSNGRVTLSHVRGKTEAVSSNGAVILEDVDGESHAETSNGAIELINCRGDVDLVTSNGRIIADVAPAETGNVAARTSNGSIELTLRTRMRAALDLGCSNGRIRPELGDLPLTIENMSSTQLRGVLGGSTAEGSIRARTSNGSITLRARPAAAKPAATPE